MRASEAVSRIPQQVLSAFMNRLPQSMQDKVSILQNPTDELIDELAYAKQQGKGWSEVAMFAQNVRQRFARPVQRRNDNGARLEENYFYGSRRFPTSAGNVIGAGGLSAGSYPFFTKGQNDEGVALGWPSGFTLGQSETNMELSGGSIPTGTNFVFNQLGISFNSDISTRDLGTMIDLVTLGFAKSGGQFSLSHGPLKMWPSGMGMSGFAAGASGSGAEFAPGFLLQAVTNGVPDIRAVRSLRIPRVLRAQESFQYGMIVTRPTRSTDGSTIALAGFVIATIWLFGGQKNAIAS
jgi:hypothetical protein